MTPEKTVNDDAAEEDETDLEESEEPPIISSSLAIQYTQQLQRFLQTLPDVPLSMQLALHNVESYLEDNRCKTLRQTSIQDYFK